MKQVTRNEADFSELFGFAEQRFNVRWNPANDLFFNTILKYGSYTDLYLDELKADLPERTGAWKQATEIAIAWLESLNVSEVRVYSPD